MLDFRRDRQRTVLTRSHRGPLQVQKPLYPEGGELCHAIVIHPPGGIAGGDVLAIDATVAEDAAALITTPGATRWYKAEGRSARQEVRLRVAGTLEWLPQETIVFDAAQVHSSIDIDVVDNGAMLGWDIVALGRGAAGESFRAGGFAQSIRLHDAGELQWIERTLLDGGDALLESPVGLDGQPIFGCLWAFGPHWSDETIEGLRERLPGAAPITRLAPRLLVARTLGATTQAVRRNLEAAWRELRPLTLGREAIAPRIWAT